MPVICNIFFVPWFFCWSGTAKADKSAQAWNYSWARPKQFIISETTKKEDAQEMRCAGLNIFSILIIVSFRLSFVQSFKLTVFVYPPNLEVFVFLLVEMFGRVQGALETLYSFFPSWQNNESETLAFLMMNRYLLDIH